MYKGYFFIYNSRIESPFASYATKHTSILSNTSSYKAVCFNIPAKDKAFFKTNSVPLFKTIFSKLSPFPGNEGFPINYFDALVKTTSSLSSDYLAKLTRELSSFSHPQMELFLEANRYNFHFAKKANLLIDVLRIKNGVITNKVISRKVYGACEETYLGFVRAIKENTIKAITVKIDGKDKLLLVKSYIGRGEGTYRTGVNTLALDPTNLSVYGISKTYGVKNSAFEKFTPQLIFEKELFINPHRKTIVVDPKLFERMLNVNPSLFERMQANINELNLALKKLSFEKQAKNIVPFKADVKKMVSDPETLKIIKERHIKKEPSKLSFSKVAKIKNRFKIIKKKFR